MNCFIYYEQLVINNIFKKIIKITTNINTEIATNLNNENEKNDL